MYIKLILKCYFQNNKLILSSTCQDLSDKVFQLNQVCTEEIYVELYNKTVCSGMVYNGGIDDIRYCKDLDSIIRDHKTDSDYWDPHKCTDSCKEPGYGCLACTNPHYFQCTKNHQKVCIHPKLVCNHHPDCDNAQDEQFDACYNEYLKRGLIEEFAILKCPSKIYPNMETVATVCDDIEECHGGEDEPNTCKNSSANLFLWVSLGALISVYLALKIYVRVFQETFDKDMKS